MTIQFLRCFLVGAGLLATPLLFADPGQSPPPKAEREALPADDPLPDGAKIRFGVSRPILRTNPSVALTPPEYTTLLAPTLTGGVRRYDVGTGRPLEKKGVVGPGQVIVSADGKRAAVARPGALTVVDVETGKQLLAVEPPEGVLLVGTPGVFLSADGKTLAYGAQRQDKKGAAVVVDVDKNVVLAQVATIQPAPIFLELSRDGKTLVTHGPPAPAIRPSALTSAPKAVAPAAEAQEAMRTAQVWDVEAGKERFKARVTGTGGAVVAAAFSADGERVVVSAGDGPLDVWDVRTGRRLQTLLGVKGQGVRVAFSPDGKTIASIGPDYRLQRWDADGKPLEIVSPPAGLPVGAITGLTFTDNYRVIAWLTVHQFAFAWDATAAQLLSPSMIHRAAVHSIAFSAADKTMFTSGLDGKVFGWDMATGETNDSITLSPGRLPGQPLIQPVVYLSADCARAIWLNVSETEIFDVASGQNLFVVPSLPNAGAAVQIGLSPDGTRLITSNRQAEGRSGSCIVWDLTTRQRVAEFDVIPFNSAGPPAAVFSPDGSRVVIVGLRVQGGQKAIVFVGYDLKTGKKLAEVEDPTTASGTLTVTAADNEWAAAIFSSGRVTSVNYAKGEMGEDFDTFPTRAEPPMYGPMAFSPDGKRLAICVADEPYTTYGVRVYDWPQKKKLHTFLGHRGPVTTLRFTSDGAFLASGSQDTSVLLWDLSKMAKDK